MASRNQLSAPNFVVTEDSLAALAERAVARLHETVSAIVDHVTPEEATFENVIRPIAFLEGEVNCDVQFMSLLQSVAPSAEIRTAASKACQEVDMAQSSAALYQNEKLWLLVDAVYNTADREALDAESRLFLKKLHRIFVGRGMKFQGEARERFAKISDRLIKLRVDFMDNIATDPGNVWLSEQDLDGLPKGKLESLERGADGKRRVTLSPPGVSAVMRHCHVSETRKEVFIRSQSAYAGNIPLFREAVLLRDEAARLHGYSSFAAQRIEDQMAKTTKAVDDFLAETKERLLPLLRSELKLLNKLRAEDSPLHLWDFHYYHQQMLKERRVDHELVSEYFPAEHTIRQMMDIFQQLFGLSITELTGRADGEVWHPDVKAFAVSNADDGEFIGHLYTDIYPRPGKYNHAANFNIRPSYIDREGNRVPVATSLICNMSPPSADRPALLQHSEVVIIFHELGHGMHDLLGKTRYAMFHGHRTVRDFTETPSQLLEYWCWTPDVLQRLSCHYSHLSDDYRRTWSRLQGSGGTAQPPRQIPQQLIVDLVAAKHVNQGILTARQIAFALFDMKVHDPPSHEELEAMDISDTYNSLLQEVTHLAGCDDGSSIGNGHVVTNHFMWGVEASYYSYIQTRMYAADIWSTCFCNDPMDPAAALRYRQIVLSKGGSADEARLLVELLGRSPRPDAFVLEIGAGI